MSCTWAILLARAAKNGVFEGLKENFDGDWGLSPTGVCLQPQALSPSPDPVLASWPGLSAQSPKFSAETGH